MPLTPAEFRAKFPLIIAWINTTLADHRTIVRPVGECGFPRLPAYYRPALLASAKVVVVDRLPVPPLSRWGLSQFAAWEKGDYSGITYLDTFFVKRDESENEALHFHELVHVVQWSVLGPEQFVARYAAGLEEFGYWESPLERAAYDLEARFKSSPAIFDAEPEIVARLAG